MMKEHSKVSARRWDFSEAEMEQLRELLKLAAPNLTEPQRDLFERMLYGPSAAYGRADPTAVAQDLHS